LKARQSGRRRFSNEDFGQEKTGVNASGANEFMQSYGWTAPTLAKGAAEPFMAARRTGLSQKVSHFWKPGLSMRRNGRGRGHDVPGDFRLDRGEHQISAKVDRHFQNECASQSESELNQIMVSHFSPRWAPLASLFY